MAIGTPVNLGTAIKVTAGTTFAIVTTADAAAGTTIFVALALRDQGNTANPACTDSSGNTYVRIGRATGTGITECWLFRCSNNTALLTLGTITLSGLDTNAASRCAATAFYVSGLDLTSPQDQFASADGVSATSNSGNITTTTANQILIGFEALAGSFTWTQDPDYASDVNGASTVVGGTSDRAIRVGTRIVSSTETNNYTTTLVDSITWVACVVSYKEAGTPTGNPWYFYNNEAVVQ